jgi:hypothetical protein
MEVKKKTRSPRQQETEGNRDGRDGRVDPFYGFRPLYLLLQRGSLVFALPHSLPHH